MIDLNIKEVRSSLGVTQKQLAEMLGVSVATIQNWEYGGKIPRTKHQTISALLKDVDNSISCHFTPDKALEEIASLRKLLEKSQEQIDKLLGIIERLQQ